MFTQNVWHPNIRAQYICIGRLTPGTALVDILYQIFEVLTYTKWNTADGMNRAACAWAREHQAEFPIDRRPLKRRTLSLEVKPL
jgi:ubiquitin-protein ligase